MASVIPSAPLGTDAATGRFGLGAATGVAPAGGGAGRRFRFELAAHPSSPAQARRLARTRLTGWSVCPDTCDTVALVITELVTNAIVHTASSRVVCELLDRGDTVRIAVHDEGCAPGEPQPSPQRPEEEHGRGLLLVDALCRAWGAQERGAGLLVWAELAREADAPGDDLGTPCAGLDAPCAGLDAPCTDTGEPRDDLGWGARAKPAAPHGAGHGAGRGGPGHGSGEDAQAKARHDSGAPGRIPRERDRSWGRP